MTPLQQKMPDVRQRKADYIGHFLLYLVWTWTPSWTVRSSSSQTGLVAHASWIWGT